MQSLATFNRLLVTVFLAVSFICITCNARKQHFSGSHSFDEDEEDTLSNDNVQLYRNHEDPLSGTGSNRKFSSVLSCPSKNVTETKGWGIQSCAAACTKDEDCDGNGYKCSCDGPCGLTCNKIAEEREYCGFPGRVENGRVLVVGKLGLYDYRNQLKRFSHNQKIIFECDRGYTLAHGPTGKTCRNGLWLPAADNPQCAESDGPAFRWIRSTRKKRRAIKTGGGTFARSKGPGGGGGGGGERGSGAGRRPNRKNGKRPGEDDDWVFGPMACPTLDHDDFMLVEVIKHGEDENNTYSVGAVAKISCTPGFGMNLNNETVTCEKGKWRPKLPQCSALPCEVPYVVHGTFYVGSKPLFFQELKPHEVKVELKCSKGYMPARPTASRLQCWYGEWKVEDAPECVPAGCKLPPLEKGMYLKNYTADMFVRTGTEVDYICDVSHQKPHSSGLAKPKCDHGEWKPTSPRCMSVEAAKNASQNVTQIKRACGNPPLAELAIAYIEGIPIEHKTTHWFPHGMEIMYRCVIIRPRSKNRWKITCDNGTWNVTLASFIKCEGNVTIEDKHEVYEVAKFINSSCTYHRTDKNVASFHNDKEIVDEQADFVTGSFLVSRCVDIGKFQLKGAQRRKCISGQWMGLTPKCDGLSQYHDYAVDKSPTILFRFVNGSIAQTVDSKLIVYPGTTLHMECIYLRKFGRPSWEVSHKNREYAEGWTDGIPDRDPSLEYRLTINNATKQDTGLYRCSTPTRHSHQIYIIVEKVDCQALPTREDLVYSTNSTTAGTRVFFDCKDNSSLLVGNTDVQCQATGAWNGGLPRCETIECPDISIVPAMAPLAETDITRNGTLFKNETAPPKITVKSRDVGGKALFTCPQGFIVEGEPEAVCQSSGDWSNAIPLCKEVECGIPPEPENGYVKGTMPYKAGDIAQIECKGGFMMEGKSMVACQDDGKWSRPLMTTKCIPACTYPGTNIGGTMSVVKFLYPIGDVIQYNCPEGHQLVGESILKCLKTAKWSHPVPKCVPKSGDDGRSYMRMMYSRPRKGSKGKGMMTNDDA